MTRRLIVTGVDGFVGRHLARTAARAGVEVFGISRSRTADPVLSEHLAGYVSADLRELWPTGLPADAAVVHLAGLAAVGPSFDRPQDYITANSAMVTNMCEALVAAGHGGRVVGVSTGAVYAQAGDDPARSEGAAVAFSSPYVVSKVLVENQLSYYRGRGLQTVTARPFNHVGPGQGPGFIVPDLLAQLRTLPPGEPLRVGNLLTRRDYTDVRDVARAYLELAFAETLAHDLYNVASGAARSGEEVLGELCKAAGLPLPRIEVDPARVRATDPLVIIGNASRLRSETEWAPQIPFDRTIADAVESAGGAVRP
jgi:GDP-4-dehydro-6-deoxy-D-mannose reductase